jgi:hypothetical protein
MRSSLAAAFAVVALAGCAIHAPSPDAFDFAVMGDAPYSDLEEQRFLGMLGSLDGERLAFIVHVGDFKAGGGSPCTDALYARRKLQFESSVHPFIYTPGDNDWTDCRRESNGSTDPVERLAKLREVFFAAPRALGRAGLAVNRDEGCVLAGATGCECPALPENLAWQVRGVWFVTLNIPGSNNNSGFDAASDREARCRNAANARWLAKAFEAAAWPHARGLAIFVQANPWETSRDGAYDAFLAQLASGAAKLGKPVLFVHGDTHTYRHDETVAGPDGKAIANLARLETYGSPLVGWVRVTADPGDPRLFSVATGGLW